MAQATRYKRILIKLSGEVFGGKSGFGFDHDVISALAAQIFRINSMGVAIGLVIGGGNIFRGARSAPHNMDRVAGDHMGMLATVINSIYMQSALEALGTPTRTMSAIAMHEVAEPYIKRRVDHHLARGRVVIFAAGTGNPYFTTDTAASLRASEMGAEILIKGTKVDGVYDKDPHKHADAVKFDTLGYDEVLARNLNVMDSTGVAFCRENAMPILVVNIEKPDSLYRAVMGEQIGTLVK